MGYDKKKCNIRFLTLSLSIAKNGVVKKVLYLDKSYSLSNYNK